MPDLKIVMRATYSILTWDDEPDTYPAEEGGYTSPTNPWGGLRWEVPAGLVGDEFALQRDENAETIEFSSPVAAGQFVADFPGGVWDFREGEYSNLRSDGTEMQVTLHVPDEHQEAVFAMADRIEAVEAKRLNRLAARRTMRI